MSTQINRSENGVKERADGKGDAWADSHRQLGATYNMSDLDAVMGVTAFAQNTGEKLFLEYVPDNYANRGKQIRSFAAVAMFDRKLSEHAIQYSDVSTSLYLWICRTLGEKQPVPPKFFYIIGGQAPPWRMIELDIETGEQIGQQHEMTKDNSIEWKNLWVATGLHALREECRRFIDPK
jgi:hypothetical protein